MFIMIDAKILLKVSCNYIFLSIYWKIGKSKKMIRKIYPVKWQF